MAEETESPQPPPPPPPPTYLEVYCKSSKRTRRFAAGTDAGSAVTMINRTLRKVDPLALHIEAVKEGEEPIAFGPKSVLVDYGDGWKLRTFNEADEIFAGPHYRLLPTPVQVSSGLRTKKKSSKPISFLYIFKVVFAFILLFVLGAIFTLVLDNLPALILFIKSLK
ncbi:Maltase-glucoamylase, intestinal [Senna tora]|uniref:Maltase-glucoamylase, intestinal n=1 Tax=Senna tora TaxID=362788 RepID=A0A834WJH1_9FABA|nr:Maltase-glucoamylase, intestinal [Senna tora]